MIRSYRLRLHRNEHADGAYININEVEVASWSTCRLRMHYHEFSGWAYIIMEHAKTQTIASNTTHMTVATDPDLKHTPNIPDIHDGQQITQWMISFNWNESHDWHAASAWNALTLMRESTNKKMMYWAECMTVLQNINAVIIMTRNIEMNDMTEVSNDWHDCHDPMARRILVTRRTLGNTTLMIIVTAITKKTHKAELARLTRFTRLAWLKSLASLTTLRWRTYWHGSPEKLT